jgi:malonate-semialdehyde dehydrogenase (acetylating)/methylmalonate-semialdehyde dehydrogenase
VARYVYGRAASNGKRVQCGGGAKNPLVIMPDADMSMTTQIVSDSAFGSAGQRCLAASMAITIGGARKPFIEAIGAIASKLVVGFGLEDGVQMGPVITPERKARIEGIIDRAPKEGARVLIDGRDVHVPKYSKGNFLRPTILENVVAESEVATTEIFGPVLGLMHAETLEEAIEIVNQRKFGNMASIFTSNGSAARKFRYEVDAGNVGVNIGVAAPMAFFPFSGWNDSFFGDLHGQGMDAVDFFTQKKIVVERWPKEWSRKF